ncbi:hypothetical protein KFL_005040070, partial [Klebsormidium nitens]
MPFFSQLQAASKGLESKGGGALNGKDHQWSLGDRLAGIAKMQKKLKMAPRRARVVDDETSSKDDPPSKRTRSHNPAPSYARSTNGGDADPTRNEENMDPRRAAASNDITAQIRNMQAPLSPRNANAQGQAARKKKTAGVPMTEAMGVASRADQDQTLNATQMVKFERAKAKVKECKAKIGTLEKENKDLRVVNLSLEKSLAAMRDRYELPDYLKPEHLKKIAKRVISAFLRGDQFYSDLYPTMDNVYKVFLAEQDLAHSSDRRRFKDYWDSKYGQKVMTKLGDRRSKLGGRFRKLLGEEVKCVPMPQFPDDEEEAAARQAIRDKFASDKIWIAGPNAFQNTENGEIAYEESEGDEPEPLKGRVFRVAYAGTIEAAL